MLNTILVPVDGSPLSARAIPYAAPLAAAAGARLLVLQATYANWAEQPDPAALEPLLEKARASGAAAELSIYSVHHDDMARAIVEAAGEKGADLIVMSTHGRSGLGRWVYGSVADEVLRQSNLPVLVIPAFCEWLWPHDRPMRMLVPLDGSVFSETSLEPALEIGAAMGAEITLFQVVQRFNFDFDGAAAEADRAMARQYLDGFAKSLAYPVRTVEVAGGADLPAQVIARYAMQNEFDLISMATHGRGGLIRLALGSVAMGTLHKVSIPLLLVRPTTAAQRSEPVAAPATFERVGAS